MSRHRFRLLSRLAAALGVLLLVLLVVAALALPRVGEWARVAVEDALQERFVPPLRIAEPVEIALLPLPTVKLRGITLGAIAADPELRVAELRVRLESAPLWRGELEVASLRARGVELILREDAEGWNVARWLRPGDPAAAPAAPPPIERITVENARVRLQSGLAGELTELRLTAGPFAPGRPGSVELTARALAHAPQAGELALNLTADILNEDGAWRLEVPRLTAQGELAGWQISGAELSAASAHRRPEGAELRGIAAALRAAFEDSSLALEVALPRLAGAGGRWQGEALSVGLRGARAEMQWRAQLAAATPELDEAGWRLGGLAVEAAGEGTAAPLALTLRGALHAPAQAPLRLAAEEARIALPHPAGAPEPLAVDFKGQATLDPAPRIVTAELAGRFDDSRFQGSARLDPDTAPPLVLNLHLDRLDLDRYLPPPAAEPEPPELAAWRSWPVAAELRVDRLKVRGLDSRNARLRLEGDGSLTAAR